MSVTVTELSAFERRLTLRFGGRPLDEAQTKAARRLSHEVHINGFRRGKAPRRMVERVVGKARVRHEAIHDMIDQTLFGALEEAGLVPAVSPSVDDVRDGDGKVEVDVLVTLRPTLEAPPDYEGRRFELDDFEVGGAALDRRIEDYLEPFAELETVERPALEGDHLAIDVNSLHEDRQLGTFSAADLLYEVGSDGLLDGLDEKLPGCSAGDVVRFASSLRFEGSGLEAGTPVEVEVVVKEVKEKRLPDLDDDWVSDFTEFETVKEMEGAFARQMEDDRLTDLREQFHHKVFSELVDEIEVDIPPVLIEDEAARILERFSRRLEEIGTDLDAFLGQARQDRESFMERVNEEAVGNLRTGLLMRAVIDEAGIDVGDEELRAFYERAASVLDETAEDLEGRMAGTVHERSVVSDILINKARAAVLRGAVAVDRDGNVLDLRFDEPEADGADETVEAEIVQAEVVEAEVVEDETVEAVIEPEDR